MGLKTSGETMQSLNNSSRRCSHDSAIFSPPGFVLPMSGAGREAIVFTTCYVMQWGAKAGHTVGIVKRKSTLACRSDVWATTSARRETFPSPLVSSSGWVWAAFLTALCCIRYYSGITCSPVPDIPPPASRYLEVGGVPDVV